MTRPIESCSEPACVDCGEAPLKAIWGFGLLARGWDVHSTSSEDAVGRWRCPACSSGRSLLSTSIRETRQANHVTVRDGRAIS
jgi:hypothetical protein